MTNIAKTSVAKALVAFVAAAMIFTMFATPAKAATSVEDLQKMINDLMAQIAALQGTTGTTTGGNCAAIPAPLTIGAQNANVTALQNYLIAAGQVIPAGATGYFGTQTQTALAAWQAANGVSPAAGYYGPITASAMAAKCVPGNGEGEGSSNGDLKGGEGDIDVETSVDGSISIDLGKTDIALEFDVEAVDSDVEINRVDFFFSSSTNASALVRPWLYFDEVNLLVDGKEVASLDSSSDFSEVSGGEYRARFSGLDIVIEEDETSTIALELVVLDSMSGTRASDVVRVALKSDSIRFMDAAGLSETGGEAAHADVDFEDTFGEGDISVSVSDNSPEAATIVLDETSRSKATVVNFDVEAEDSDIEVDSVVLVLAATGDTVADTVYRARLMDGNTELSSKAVTGATTTFDNLDYMIDEDDEVELHVELEFNRGEDVTATALEVVSVQVTGEDSDYTTVTDTATVSEEHSVVTNGLVAEAADVTVTKNNNVTTVEFEFDVTAYGEDFYLSATSADAIVYTFSSPASTTLTAAPTINVSGVSVNGSNNYKITKGQTRTVTVSYSWTNTGTALQYVTGQLDTLRYKTSATDTAIGGDETATLGATNFKLPTNVSIAVPN